jgi:hypothetical protein
MQFHFCDDSAICASPLDEVPMKKTHFLHVAHVCIYISFNYKNLSTIFDKVTRVVKYLYNCWVTYLIQSIIVYLLYKVKSIRDKVFLSSWKFSWFMNSLKLKCFFDSNESLKNNSQNFFLSTFLKELLNRQLIRTDIFQYFLEYRQTFCNILMVNLT